MSHSPYPFRLPPAEKEILEGEAAVRGLSLNAYLSEIVRARARIDVCGGEIIGERSARAVRHFRAAFVDDLLGLYRIRNGNPDHWRGVAILSDACTMPTRRRNKVLEAFGRAEVGNWAAARFIAEGHRVFTAEPHPWTELVRSGYPVYLNGERVVAAIAAVVRSAFEEKKPGPLAIANGPGFGTKPFLGLNA